MRFLDGLDSGIRQSLLKQIRDLWTHHSTAIEGNSLTLGETNFILEEGLPVSGKSFEDHEEVAGHAKAIDLIDGVNRETILRRFVQDSTGKGRRTGPCA